jgi:hypothetical protein
MATVLLLVYMYEVVTILGGPFVCVQYCLVLILFDGYFYLRVLCPVWSEDGL